MKLPRLPFAQSNAETGFRQPFTTCAIFRRPTYPRSLSRTYPARTPPQTGRDVRPARGWRRRPQANAKGLGSRPATAEVRGPTEAVRLREALEGPPARRLGTLGSHSCWGRAVRAGPLRADNLRWPGTGADGRLQGFPEGDAEPQRVGPGDISRRARAPRGCPWGQTHRSGPGVGPTRSALSGGTWRPRSRHCHRLGRPRREGDAAWSSRSGVFTLSRTVFEGTHKRHTWERSANQSKPRCSSLYLSTSAAFARRSGSVERSTSCVQGRWSRSIG